MAVHAGAFSAALALTPIAWGPALDGWFLLDDYRWVLPSDRPFDVLRSFVSTWGHGVAYRFVMRVSFSADLVAFGWNAWAWHLRNPVLHAVNVTLLWSLMRAATSMPVPAFAVAALFAVSPLGHENIAWISGRTHLLGVTFLLLGANLLLRSWLARDADESRPLTVLYAREAVLQAYDRRDRGDARVFFAEDLRSLESYHVRSAAPARGDRPARHFHFDRETLTLAEVAGLDAEQAHDAPSSW